MTETRSKSFLNLFPPPTFLQLSLSGIVITDGEIKFIELKRGVFTGKLKLSRIEKINNTEGAIEAGIIVNEVSTAKALKDLAYKYGVRYVRSTLPEERAYIFTTLINNVPKEGLKDAVSFTIEENAPVSLAESLFDFEVVEFDEDSGQIKVSVSVVPRSLVSAYTALFESAGITPISFDLESQAIARAVIKKGDGATNLIVNFAYKKTGFYVVDKEVVQFSSTPPHGLDIKDPDRTINELKRELLKVIDFWNGRTDEAGRREGVVQKITFCGAGSNQPDLIKKIMENINLPYSIADVWANLSSQNRGIITTDESLDYASSIGLVLSNKT